MVASILAVADPNAPDLAPPIQLQAGGQPINVDMGHAAPFVADLAGDGNMTLLVGQFGEGKLRLYPNVGTRKDPKFDKFEWFQAGGKVVSLPAG
jgi:hypothetical protein